MEIKDTAEKDVLKKKDMQQNPICTKYILQKSTFELLIQSKHTHTHTQYIKRNLFVEYKRIAVLFFADICSQTIMIKLYYMS